MRQMHKGQNTARARWRKLPDKEKILLNSDRGHYRCYINHSKRNNRKHPDYKDYKVGWDLQQVIKTFQNIIGAHLLSISDICEVRCLFRGQRILKDNTHPIHSLFSLLLSGRYRRITRLQSSFILCTHLNP
ncbi:hypothetical protein L3Q82_011549 [Scortum barcoo]|uniref:Uncharacterized protein n=1 Tax=Scortum barcoo TaxID=214431 RepID=A0ACB8W6W0_9TELE|nr:hypothetical protein L3Q82_011549 [Scortum barcoo]